MSASVAGRAAFRVRRRSRRLVSRGLHQARAPRVAPLGASGRQDALLTTCMREIPVILNALLHSKISWQTPALAAATATFPLLGARFPTRLLVGYRTCLATADALRTMRTELPPTISRRIATSLVPDRYFSKDGLEVTKRPLDYSHILSGSERR